jgi:Protein of unknown function (DUF3617)
LRKFILLLAFFSARAQAQHMEPGQWEFVSEVALPGLPPQQSAAAACLDRDQARDPLNWSQGTRLPSDCRVATLKLGPDHTSWELDCPASGMRGAGQAQISRNSMQSELKMTGDAATKTRGRRLGPCKP